MACLNTGWAGTSSRSNTFSNTSTEGTWIDNDYYPIEAKEEIVLPSKKEIQKQLSKDAIPKIAIDDQLPDPKADNRVSLIRKESKNEWSGKNFKRRK